MLQMIAITHLHDDPRSANRMSEERLIKLKANIQETGQMQPLIVRSHPKKKEHFILIDGHQRKRGCQELGQIEVPCIVWDITEKKAGLLLASLNCLRGEDHPGKRAELLHSLKLDYGIERLCELIPENESELNELLALLDQQTEDLKAMLERQQAEEASLLPVILNFVLSQTDAEMVKIRLSQLDTDINIALVKLCQEEMDHGEIPCHQN